MNIRDIQKENERLGREKKQLDKDLGLIQGVNRGKCGVGGQISVGDLAKQMRLLNVMHKQMVLKTQIAQAKLELQNEAAKTEAHIQEMQEKLAETPELAVTSPSVSQVFNRGGKMEVKWVSRGIVGDYLKLVLQKGGAYAWTMFSGAPNNGRATCQLSPSLESRTDYTVAIEDRVTGLKAISDPFEIK